MQAKKPCRKDGILSRKLGDEWLLYDSENGTVHILNSTAEFVWRLSDGSHTTDDIEKHMVEAYEVPDAKNIREEISDILRTFYGLRILVS